MRIFYIQCGGCGVGYNQLKPDETLISNYRLHVMHDHTKLFLAMSRRRWAAYGRRLAERRDKALMNLILGGTDEGSAGY